MTDDEKYAPEGAADFKAPETGVNIEVEKPIRELFINSEGRVEGQGLDDIEKYLFEKASFTGIPAPSPFPHIAIYGLAQRLGFEVIEKDALNKPLRDNSRFGRTDSKMNDVSYQETPVAKDAKLLVLKKHEIPTDDGYRRRHNSELFIYEIDNKITGVDRDIINGMLPSK